MLFCYPTIVAANSFVWYCFTDQIPCGAALVVAALELLGQQERNLNTDWLSCEINKLLLLNLLQDENVICSIMMFHVCAIIINWIKYSNCRIEFVLLNVTFLFKLFTRCSKLANNIYARSNNCVKCRELYFLNH